MEILSNSDKKYYLINGEFMRNYKEYYNYEKFRNIIEVDENLKHGFHNIKQQILYCKKNKINYESYINSLIQNFKEDFINELGQKRENQSNFILNLKNESNIKYRPKKTRSGKILIYYEENEILNPEFIHFFAKSEDEQIVNLIKNEETKNLIFGEKKIFINLQSNNYFYLNIGHLKNNLFSSDLIIYFHSKKHLEEFISKIRAESFDKYIQPYLKDIKEKNILRTTDNKGEKLGNIIK